MPDNFIHGDDEMTIVSYGLMRTLTKEFDEAEAEIARLRKIEEAAREAEERLSAMTQAPWLVTQALDALRAALLAIVNLEADHD